MGAMKNWLKKLLPPPVNSFMREVNRIVAIEEKNQALIKQLQEKVEQQSQQLQETVNKQNKQDEQNADIYKKRIQSVLHGAVNDYRNLDEPEKEKIRWENGSFEAFLFNALVR